MTILYPPTGPKKRRRRMSSYGSGRQAAPGRRRGLGLPGRGLPIGGAPGPVRRGGGLPPRFGNLPWSGRGPGWETPSGGAQTLPTHQPRTLDMRNPNDFFAHFSQRDPQTHQAYWRRQGWQLNPRTDSFTRMRGVGGDIRYPPGYQGHGPPPPANTAGGGGGPGGQGGLPLDPYLEQQRRLLSDALSGNLAALGPAREQLLASSRLGETRLGTNEDIDERRLLDEMAARGIVGSGIQARDTGRLATDYMRSRQDLANTTAGGLNDLALAEAGYRGDYNRGLIEALMASAANAAMDPYAPVPTQTPGAGPRPRPGPGPGPVRRRRQPTRRGPTRRRRR